MNRRARVGFDRRIDVEWLDAAAAQAATGATSDEMRAYLWKLLDGAVSGDTHDGARRKTVTVLNRIWGQVPGPALSLRDRCVAQLADCTRDERLALHWVMMVSRYPVFTDTAAAIGRLLALQGGFTLVHVVRRLVSAWGERSTLTRASQRIVRSMVQWGVLLDTSTAGSYEATPKRKQISAQISVLLVEALLIDAEEQTIPLDHLVVHPAVFPFELSVNASHIRATSQLQLHRQGLDSDVVELREGKG